MISRLSSQLDLEVHLEELFAPGDSLNLLSTGAHWYRRRQSIPVGNRPAGTTRLSRDSSDRRMNGTVTETKIKLYNKRSAM